MKLIGVGGTNGSGKDTIGQILEEKYGWKFISLTDMLREFARSEGLSTERKDLRVVSERLREERGTGVMVDLCIEAYKKLDKEYKGLVIASLRNGGEPDRVHEFGGIVIWVDAPVETRYKRIHARMREDDHLTFAEFKEQENIEMFGGQNQNQLRTIDVKEKADIHLQNTTSVDDFERELINQLKTINYL